MDYTPVTPFRRAINAADLQHLAAAQADLPPQGVNKWEVLRELGTARTHLGLSDRELTVLQALLSFHPETILGGNSGNLTIHPSNAAICTRLGGMACSTMRRHLGALVRAGLLIRRDSPNGKRYARRFGGEKQVFGFDLTPLVQRHAEICALAEQTRADAERYKRLRQSVSLMRRDLAGLVAYGADLDPGSDLWAPLASLAAHVSQAFRRKLTMADLEAFARDLSAGLDAARDRLDGNAEELSSNGAQNEQRHQNSKTDHHDLEPCLEQQRAEPAEQGGETEDQHLPNIPLGLVLAVCHEIQSYLPDRIRHWHHFVRAAEVIRPMLGISPSAWEEAVAAMGPEQAAVVLAAILERQSAINAPGGYLRALTRKAEAGAFSCGPMIMALHRRDAA